MSVEEQLQKIKETTDRIEDKYKEIDRSKRPIYIFGAIVLVLLFVNLLF